YVGEPRPVTTSVSVRSARIRAIAARRGSLLSSSIRQSLKSLAPSMRCESKTATASPPLKQMRAAASTAGAAAAASVTSYTITPPTRRLLPLTSPIGTCHGFASPHSPRMVTIMSNGKPHTFTSESVLMQLPTPLLCMRRTPRSPPSQAPAKMPIPSSSVVRTVGSIPSVAWHNSISYAWPASGTYATWRTSNWRSFSNIRFGQFCACPPGLVEHARLGQALHGHDIRVVCLRSVLRTAAHCYSIDQNRTSSAYPMLTADVNSEGLKVMTQEIAEEHARLSLARS